MAFWRLLLKINSHNLFLDASSYVHMPELMFMSGHYRTNYLLSSGYLLNIKTSLYIDMYNSEHEGNCFSVCGIS